MRLIFTNDSLLRRLLCLCLCLAMLFSLVPAGASLAEGEILLETRYDSPGSDKQRVWQFPYSDELFYGASGVYNHTLAQSSLGMALSAFRSKHIGQDEQDKAARAYLTGAGFSELVSADYEKIPTIDTVSTLIGEKKMDGFTLVAVAVCGGGYGNEWTSNFTIGNGERYEGFNDASMKVQARIREYLSGHGITGSVKLWIAGYSRAAAITNLTAADLTDSGLFTDVFAYVFATPRTTKAPKAYPNIFNIIGKFDPVPMIPAAEWGFGRNGVMLYTPAEETDSDYYLKKAAADVVSRKLTGIAFFNNTEMNNTLRTILDYLMTIIPDTATYEEHMQDIMISIWKDKGLSNLSSKLIGMMENENLLNETTKEEMEQLLDYLSLITYSTVSQRLFGGSGSWNSQTTVLDNLAHEHSPDVYVSWLFSADNADKLYSAADTYVRIAWSGAATTNVFDKEGRFVLSIDKDGRVSHSTGEPLWAASAQPIEQRPLLPCVHKNEATLLTLPRDGTYLLYLRAEKDDSLYYIGSEYNINSVRSPVNKATIVDMEKGEDYVIMSLTDEYAEDGEHLLGSSTEDIALTDEGMPYSPSFMTILENSGVFHLTFGQMAMLVGAVLMLLIIIITCLIVHFVRRHKRKKRQKAKLSQGAGESDAGIEIKS